jgi:hypothetical protein
MGARPEIHAGFCCENLKENELERPRCRWGNNIRIDIQEICGKTLTGLI